MRRNTLIKIWLGCVLIGSFVSPGELCAGEPSDTTFLPLRIGNRWTLVRNGLETTERIVDTVRIKGALYFRFDTLSYQTNVLLRESGSRVYRYVDSVEVLWYDFGADSGAHWTIPQQGLMTVEGTNDSVKVPAGNFSGCRSFLWYPGPDAGSTEWFARGVGLARRELNTIAGPSPWFLKNAVVTSVDSREGSGQFSAGFRLEQNYPNPFNPRTVVGSQLPVVSNFKLAVYDLLGREVAVLVNERRPAGTYKDVFDASGLASGVYVCRLQAGEFVQAQRMLLIK